MKRCGLIVLLCLLCGGAPLRAQGPGDQFIQIYSLIQQGDMYRDHGQKIEAKQAYVQAYRDLDKLAKDYPYWEPAIIQYRRAYLKKQLGSAVAQANAQPGQPVPTQKPASPQATEIAMLRDKVAALTKERDGLQAKLREALAIQPTVNNPQALAKAVDQAKTLRAENDQLQSQLRAAKDQLAHAVTTTNAPTLQKALKETHSKLTDAQHALKEAQDALTKEKERVDKLTKEKAELEKKLKTAPAGADQSSQLKSELEKTRRALADETKRANALSAEKTALARRTAELSRAATQNTKPAARPVSRSERRRQEATAKAEVKMLRRERNQLRRRVDDLSRELSERRAASSSTSRGQLVDELKILRARVEAYESQKEPYTAAEMALFKANTNVGNQQGEDYDPKARPLPSRAQPLVAEAQDDFQNNRLAAAEQKYEQALKLANKNVRLLNDLAATQIQRNRLTQADTTLQRSLALDQENADTLTLIGLLRFKQSRYKDAVDVLSRAAQLNPDNATTQNYLGIALSQQGLREPAEAALRKAVILQPGYADAQNNLAVIYATEKPPLLALARYHYQKALDLGHARNPALDKLLHPNEATTTASAK